MVRKDRNFRETNTSRGGGILLAFNTQYNVEQLNLSQFTDIIPSIDVLGCKCLFKYLYIFFIYVLYIPPHVTKVDLELFFDMLETLIINQHNVLLLGDFNATHFISRDLNDLKSQIIENFLEFTNLRQVNTHLNVHGRLLDLVITDMRCLTTRENLPLVKEDNHHPAIVINFNLAAEKNDSLPTNLLNKTYNFKKANFHGLYEALLVIDWSFLETFTDVNVACSEFYKMLYSILDLYVPYYKNKRCNYPSWYTSDIIRNLKLKYTYLKKFRATNNQYFYQEFSRLRALIKNQVSIAYENYLSNVENSISTNPNNFWSYVQSKRGTSRIPGKLHCETKYYDEPQAIVNGFADYFSSVFSPKSNITTHNSLSNITNYPCINISSFNEKDLVNSLRALPNKMTAGNDLIPSFLVKDCAPVFTPPLLILFNLILKTGTFPEVWKMARVCPVLKCDSPDDIKNYRPITILCNFAKVFEISVYNQLLPQIKPFISPSQHGFVAKRSTVSNLAEFVQFISDTMDDQGQVDVVYTDFSKAFDKIDHYILLNKLEQFGFSNSLIHLFTSYLNDRPQYVGYNGFKSNIYITTSGVPQGSNLGPLLFVIFINDLATTLNCGNLLYADDLKLFVAINNIDDCVQLQSQIVELEKWCDKNKLSMNVSKCKVCSYTRKIQQITYDYRFNNISLSRCTSTRDLGIHFDSKLSFADHIKQISSAALKMLGFIIRNCKFFTNVTALKTLYFTLVRSKLEYGSLIWYPYYNVHIIALENVQRRFLKFLAFRSDGFYPNRGYSQSTLLTRFEIPSLELRRIKTTLIFLYKLLHNLIDSPALLSQIYFHVPRLNLRNSVTFYCRNARTNVLIKSPVHISCYNFNKIANICDINSCSLNNLLQISEQSFL